MRNYFRKNACREYRRCRLLISRLAHWNGMVHICLLGLTESSQKSCLSEWQKQFQDNLRSIFAQLSRAGIRIVVGHGHGPSTNAFQELKEEAAEKYGLRILTAWTFADDDRLKYQNDHAGANETSIVMAVRPELVDFGQVKENESNLIGIAGRHPVRESSVAYGNEILEYTMKTLISGIEKEYKILKES